MCLGCVTHCL
ncbi:hypothetical protein F383_28210 [Gossypium arboreum]|uniref:Uncharacterized protein n=1 Tax=Gossypium arboreum TaxID=29729 RepID=A0A0B0MQK2_GOSAR|nr:hypothetical protein F383_28210 [Gossypium arboreum]